MKAFESSERHDRAVMKIGWCEFAAIVRQFLGTPNWVLVASRRGSFRPSAPCGPPTLLQNIRTWIDLLGLCNVHIIRGVEAKRLAAKLHQRRLSLNWTFMAPVIHFLSQYGVFVCSFWQSERKAWLTSESKSQLRDMWQHLHSFFLHVTV